MFTHHPNLIEIRVRFRSLEPRHDSYVLTDCFNPGPITLIGYLVTTPFGFKLPLDISYILDKEKVTFSNN